MTTVLRPHLCAARPATDGFDVRGVGRVEVVYRGGGWEKTREEGRCRLCLRPWRIRRPTRHHLVPKSWFTRQGLPNGLRDSDANVIPLCRVCHDWIESPDDDSGRRMLRKELGSVEAALAIRLRGGAWFDSRYPASVSSAISERVERDRSAAEPPLDPLVPLVHSRACEPGRCVVSCLVYSSRRRSEARRAN